MLNVGDKIPEFTLASSSGNQVSSEELLGKRFILYFYPKDDTPGCTREACAFRDDLPKFSGLGLKVYGISADDERSHIRFGRKYQLNFPLLADPDHAVCDLFGTWVEKSMYGRTYFGVERATFVISAKGRIEHIWRKVMPDGHTEEVLAWLKGEPAPVRPAVPLKDVAMPKPVSALPNAFLPKVPAPVVKPLPFALAPANKASKASKAPPVPAPIPVPSAAAVNPAPAKTAAAAKPAAKAAAAKLKSVAKNAKPEKVAAPAKKASKPVAGKPVKSAKPARKGKAASAKTKPAAKPTKPVAKVKPPVKKAVAKKAAAKPSGGRLSQLAKAIKSLVKPAKSKPAPAKAKTKAAKPATKKPAGKAKGKKR
jgi:thioredoxin-dependent peroxiredoxin